MGKKLSLFVVKQSIFRENSSVQNVGLNGRLCVLAFRQQPVALMIIFAQSSTRHIFERLRDITLHAEVPFTFALRPASSTRPFEE